MIFLLNQCHNKVEKSGGQTMGKNSEKSDFVYDINNFNKNWG